MEVNDAELLAVLDRRLQEVEREKAELEYEITELSEAIESLTARMPKRKGHLTEKEILDEIEGLEYKRTTSSMTLAKEKTLLREQEQLKGRIKDVREWQQKDDELKSLKDRRRVAEDSARSKRESIKELRLNLKKLQFAVETHVPSQDLMTIEVVIPDDRVGLVMGKRRTALTALESECSVLCEEHIARDADGAPRAGGGGGSGGPSKLLVTGTLAACQQAKARLEKVTLAVEITVNVNSDVANALRANKWAMLHRLEQQHDCRIDLVPTTTASGGASSGGGGGGGGSRLKSDKDKTGAAAASSREKDSGAPNRVSGPAKATIRGEGAKAEAAAAALRSLRGASEHIPLDERAVPAVVGAKGCNLVRIEGEYGVAVDIRRGSGEVVVSGEASAVEAAAVELRRLAEDHAPVEETLQLTGGFQASLLLRNMGEALKALQKEHGVLMSVDRPAGGGGGGRGRDNGPPPAVRVRGPTVKVEPALEALKALLASMEERAVTIELDPESLSAVVGKGGATIKEIREGGGSAVVIDVDWSACVVKVFGEDDAAVEAAQSTIEAIADANKQRVLHLTRETALALKGQRGAEARAAITNAVDDPDEKARGLGVSLEVQPEQNGRVRLRGKEEALEAAAAILTQFAADNVPVEVVVLPDDSAVLQGGADSGLLKQAIAKFGVDARFLRDKSVVRLLGGEQAVKDTAAWLQQQLFGGDGGADDDGSVMLLTLDAASVGPIIGRGGATVKRLEQECGVSIDVLSARNAVRLRGEPTAVAAARTSLFKFISETRILGVVSVGDGQSWPSPAELREVSDRCGVIVEPRRWRTGASPVGLELKAANGGGNGHRALGDERHGRDGGSAAEGGSARGGGVSSGGRSRRGGPPDRKDGGGGGGGRAGSGRGEDPGSGGGDSGVGATRTRGELRVRGRIGDVEEARVRLEALVTGEAQAEIALEEAQARVIADSVGQPLRATLAAAVGMAAPGDDSVEWTFQADGKKIVFEGPPHGVFAARQRAFTFLEALFPGQFLQINAPEGLCAISLAVNAVSLDSMSRETGAALSVDRMGSCVRVRASSAAAAAAAAAAASKLLSEWADKNAAVPIEGWVVPLLVGKGGSGLKALVEAAGGKGLHFDVDREASVCRVSADGAAEVRAGVAALEARLTTLHNENRNVRLPAEALGGFIGRGGANINRLRTETGADFNIDKSNDGRVWVKGDAAAAAAGIAAIEEFLSAWRAENEVEERFDLGQKGAAAFALPSGASVFAALQASLEPSAIIALDAATGVVKVRGTSGACRRAKETVLRAAEQEAEAAKERAAAKKAAATAKKAAAAKSAEVAAKAAAKHAQNGPADEGVSAGEGGATTTSGAKSSAKGKAQHKEQSAAAAAAAAGGGGRASAAKRSGGGKGKDAQQEQQQQQQPLPPPPQGQKGGSVIPVPAAAPSAAVQQQQRQQSPTRKPVAPAPPSPPKISEGSKQLLSFLMEGNSPLTAATPSQATLAPPPGLGSKPAAANGRPATIAGTRTAAAAGGASTSPAPGSNARVNGGGAAAGGSAATGDGSLSSGASQLAAMLLGTGGVGGGSASSRNASPNTGSPKNARGGGGGSGASHFTSASGLKVRL